MKKNKRKFALLLTLIFISVTVLMFGCNDASIEEDFDDAFKFTSTDMLVSKNGIVEDGFSEQVVLKGVNAGGYLLIEQWMTALEGSDEMGYLDHKMVTDTFVERFGTEKTLELWEHYRNNFWTEQDFINIKEMGMNVIRLPFTYMSVDPDYNNVERIDGEKYNFRLLDEFIDEAEKYGIYTILDLHGAYGSQNGQDHSGEQLDEDEVDFYYNEENQQLTVDLWSALATHYANNPAVAGYDILNEPAEKLGSHTYETTTRHWEFFDKVYDVIREVDLDHIGIFESCWDANDFPNPKDYSWTNCMYSVHNYSGEYKDAEANLASMKTKLDGFDVFDYNVPIYMGEFSCYNVEESWEKTLQYFDEEQIWWTSWTYKVNDLSNYYNGWGIVKTHAQSVTPDIDSYDEIIEKWSAVNTADSSTTLLTFASGTTLFEVIQNYT